MFFLLIIDLVFKVFKRREHRHICVKLYLKQDKNNNFVNGMKNNKNHKGVKYCVIYYQCGSANSLASCLDIDAKGKRLKNLENVFFCHSAVCDIMF